MVIQALLTTVGLLMAPAPAAPTPQSATDSLRPRRQAYPLNCRGGEGLAYDTISPPSDTGKAAMLSLIFGGSVAAAGPEGRGLQPGSCAWVDRPLNLDEPRRIRVRIGLADSAVRDSGMHWSFLAYDSDSGYFTSVGYRYWHASWPPVASASQTQPTAPVPSRGRWLPFAPRYLPWLVLGWVVMSWAPFLMLVGAWSGWRRLARLYPANLSAPGRTVRCGTMIMGLTNYRGGTRLTADESYVHFSMWALARPGHPPFSVPWSDITLTPDGWPWFPMKGRPVIRLTLTRYRELRILVPVPAGEGLVAASAGRLRLSEPRIPPGRFTDQPEIGSRTRQQVPGDT